MNENLLQFIWQHKYLLENKLISSQGKTIEVIKPGLLNRDSGPDFFNALIRIDNTKWAGNVEVHINSSDWRKHGHQNDAAYHNVILHLVWHHDEVILNQLNEEIPTLEMKHLVQTETLEKYKVLLLKKSIISCEPIFTLPDPEILWMWIERLSTERLEKKHLQIQTHLTNTTGHWEEVFFKQLAICFGQKTNANPFELLTATLTWNLIQKYFQQHLSFQAIFIGVAGFLDHPLANNYNLTLQKEYAYLSKKHGLQKLDVLVWKFGKTRPANFPTLRLVQFAELVYSKPQFFQTVLSCKNYKELLSLFELKSPQKIDIGDLHPKGKESHFESISLSKQFIESILINVAIPMVFSYGKYTQQDFLCNRAQEWLQQVPAESNHIITRWKTLGITCKKANETQAMIQLKNYYCDQNKCLQCAIGNQILKPKKLSESSS